MAAEYPNAVPTITNPAGTDKLNSPSHSGQHIKLNEEVIALASELGTNPKGGAADVKSRLDTNDIAVTANTAHRSSDGTNHSDVVLNNSHRAGNGSDHADVASNTAARHTQNTDIGTTNNDFAVGDGVAGNKTITAQNADATKPKLRYNDTTNKWEFSNDGVVFNEMGSGSGGGDEAITKDINQVAHGFVVGDTLRHNGTSYFKAQADSAINAEVVGIVSVVTDVNNFTLNSGGYISGLSGLTAGVAHFLSAVTAGVITAIAPTAEGDINKPILVADTTTSGYIFNMRGAAVTDSSTSFFQDFTNADLTAGVLSVTHNLGHKYVIAQVYDNNDLQVIPDEIDLTGTNALDVDLSSFGAIPGTWRIVILDTGTAQALTGTPTFAQAFADGDLAAGLLAVTHNLGSQYTQVAIYNNLNKVVIPDDITATSVNVSTVDLSSFGTLTGTWQVVVHASGGTQPSTATDLNIANQAQGDVLYFNGTNWIRFPKGTALQILRINAGETAPEWTAPPTSGASVKQGSFSRDTSLASGMQSITGLGFQPKGLIFAMTNGGQVGEFSIGFDDGVDSGVQADKSKVSSGVWTSHGARSIYDLDTSGNEYLGVVASLDADGFTISWTRTGTPTGTIGIEYLAIA